METRRRRASLRRRLTVGFSGPEWGIKVTSVTWKMYFWGKTVSEHVIKIKPPAQEEDQQTYAMELIRQIDLRILRWQRIKLGLELSDISVAKASLLRPQGGIEASQGEIKRLSDGDIGELGKDELGSALQVLMHRKHPSAALCHPSHIPSVSVNVPEVVW